MLEIRAMHHMSRPVLQGFPSGKILSLLRKEVYKQAHKILKRPVIKSANIIRNSNGWETNRPMSSIDLTPDETSPTGQRVSSCKSADISIAVKENELNGSRAIDFLTLTILSPAMNTS